MSSFYSSIINRAESVLIYVVAGFDISANSLLACPLTGLWNDRSDDYHDDVIKWKHFSRNWPSVRGIHRPPANSLQKGQWRGVLIFSLICAWINVWANNREAGDLRYLRSHHDVTVTIYVSLIKRSEEMADKDIWFYATIIFPMWQCYITMLGNPLFIIGSPDSIVSRGLPLHSGMTAHISIRHISGSTGPSAI